MKAKDATNLEFRRMQSSYCLLIQPSDLIVAPTWLPELLRIIRKRTAKCIAPDHRIKLSPEALPGL